MRTARLASARRREAGRRATARSPTGYAGRRSPGRATGDAEGALTPQALAAARLEAARIAKFDRSKYETVRSLDRLKAWIERARDVGVVAHRHRDVGLDPMQAELCGFSLAVGAERSLLCAAVSHRQGGEGGNGGLFRGEIARRPDSPKPRRSRR